LAQFYRDAFGLVDRRPPRNLSGTATRGTGVPDAEIRSVWLYVPDTPRPFLEILGYTPAQQAEPRPVNAPGWGHIALEVADLRATLDAVLRLGGNLQGEIITLQGPDHRFEIVYLRDPEGNVIELEQLVDG